MRGMTNAAEDSSGNPAALDVEESVSESMTPGVWMQ
jgi:hypothetical protein